jgi:uncharacterized protein (DUF1778 family)
MFGGSSKKLKIDDELYSKIEVAAKTLGCSLEEFVVQTLSREVDKVILSNNSGEMSPEELARIENSLKGLGYLE